MTDMNKNNDGRRVCLECGKTIEFGRADKKFCCEECKSKYHNREWNPWKTKKKVLSALDRNYSILDVLVRTGVSSITNSELGILGYNHGFITSSARVRGHSEEACFDIRYFRSETRIFNIHRVTFPKMLASSPGNG